MDRITLPERPDWREKARAVGFGFHEMYGEPYWVDDAAYTFSIAEIEEPLEPPAKMPSSAISRRQPKADS